MPRYIDANELYKKIFPLDVVDKRRYSINAKAVAEAIVDMPTADVAPRAEVAREILQEVRQALLNMVIANSMGENYDIEKRFAEIEKKYTEATP